jgi:hypothetical protein
MTANHSRPVVPAEGLFVASVSTFRNKTFFDPSEGTPDFHTNTLNYQAELPENNENLEHCRAGGSTSGAG